MNTNAQIANISQNFWNVLIVTEVMTAKSAIVGRCRELCLSSVPDPTTPMQSLSVKEAPRAAVPPVPLTTVPAVEDNFMGEI